MKLLTCIWNCVIIIIHGEAPTKKKKIKEPKAVFYDGYDCDWGKS